MGFDNNDNRGRASISSQNWRATASPNTSSSSSFSSTLSRKSSFDSGYESGGSRSTSPSPLSRSSSPSFGCSCHHNYIQIYRTYKEQERVVRRWLCTETCRPFTETDLDNIDIGSLIRMANRVKTPVPFSVAQGLNKAIKGRRDVIGGWHFEEADHTCDACGRLWKKVDENHKHHIRELERIVEILRAVDSSVKTKVDPLSLRSWR